MRAHLLNMILYLKSGVNIVCGVLSALCVCRLATTGPLHYPLPPRPAARRPKCKKEDTIEPPEHGARRGPRGPGDPETPEARATRAKVYALLSFIRLRGCGVRPRVRRPGARARAPPRVAG